MSFSFNAKIYKVGINPCADVPDKLTSKLNATKGYIPVRGEINQHHFQQTLCPIKDGPYRLYVNGPMMKGANVKVGDIAKFIIQQDERPKTNVEMPDILRQELQKNKLIKIFQTLTPSRQKEIFKYLASLKTEEAQQRNLAKVIQMMREKQMEKK